MELFQFINVTTCGAEGQSKAEREFGLEIHVTGIEVSLTRIETLVYGIETLVFAAVGS